MSSSIFDEYLTLCEMERRHAELEHLHTSLRAERAARDRAAEGSARHCVRSVSRAWKAVATVAAPAVFRLRRTARLRTVAKA